MDRQNPYHPTGNVKADGVRARTDELIHYLRTETASSGPLTQSAAASAIQAYEQAAFWAVKGLTAADAVEGDGGGATGPDRSVSANDAGLDGVDRHDGQSDP